MRHFVCAFAEFIMLNGTMYEWWHGKPLLTVPLNHRMLFLIVSEIVDPIGSVRMRCWNLSRTIQKKSFFISFLWERNKNSFPRNSHLFGRNLSPRQTSVENEAHRFDHNLSKLTNWNRPKIMFTHFHTNSIWFGSVAIAPHSLLIGLKEIEATRMKALACHKYVYHVF